VDIAVWDSTAETRYLVLPVRPDGTDGLAEDELAALVTGTGSSAPPASEASPG
jgi:nitrile hydratase